MMKVIKATINLFLKGIFKITGNPNIANVSCNIKGEPLMIQIKPESMALTFLAFVKLIKAMAAAKGIATTKVTQNMIIVLPKPDEISLKI